ncbi:MAG: B12-binding domain-containing radical SAM protein [Candidatus Bathyarchaeota archaeon]|nr:B12-binding domain-containing radical SAM protein [Candidatus Bathyarchaeota archaeon]
MAVKVVLVYPYFHPARDKSIFRFPPLGLGYIAAALRQRGVEVSLVDCTFLSREEALARVTGEAPQIVGFYCMFSMKKTTLELAAEIRSRLGGSCLLVVGGPLPSWSPQGFLGVFDVVAVGEGEQTLPELADVVAEGKPLLGVKGLVYRVGDSVVATEPRLFISDLNTLPFPARRLFDNDAYKRYYQRRFGYTTTSMITSRGCPFNCDFCSRPIFGSDIRSRSAANIVDEVEEIASLGYKRVWFADDCFTLNRDHLLAVCGELHRRGVDVGWECLSRVDTLNREVASAMKRSGCVRVFFGIESGNDDVLELMNKRITTSQAKQAVYTAKAAGLGTGAFFIVGYPGETDRTVLDTLRFASSLPLDYLSFTLPYPIPGTPLYERVAGRGVAVEDWEEPRSYRLIRHKLLVDWGFSEGKLKFAIAKAQLQFYGRRYLGRAYPAVGTPFERVSDFAFRHMR